MKISDNSWNDSSIYYDHFLNLQVCNFSQIPKIHTCKWLIDILNLLKRWYAFHVWPFWKHRAESQLLIFFHLWLVATQVLWDDMKCESDIKILTSDEVYLNQYVTTSERLMTRRSGRGRLAWFLKAGIPTKWFQEFTYAHQQIFLCSSNHL